ncbi:zinc finger protein 48-like [Penaeus chinensis]|uniref:zinc finger protein 48-like n=1 Tax=Penaeus chinensis TaxID=139456 RepID=UPI001FB7602D|nr:zinc finger protein 48-like [Penaeus chinensis]
MMIVSQYKPQQWFSRWLIKMDHFVRNFWDLPDVAASQYGPGAVCYAWPFGDVLGAFSSKDIMDHLFGMPLPAPKRQCVRPASGLSWSQPKPLHASFFTPFVDMKLDLDAAPSLTSAASPPHEKERISPAPAAPSVSQDLNISPSLAPSLSPELNISPSPAPSVSQEFKSALGPITVTFLAPQVTSSPIGPSPSARRRKNAHCHLCYKRFENRYKLKMHLNTHTGDRPFTCDVCGKGFMRRTTLTGHRIIHDASQFSCPTCNRTFKRSSERLIHILLKVCLRKQRILRRTVRGWFCDVCDKSVPLPEEHQCPVKGRRRQCPVCGMDFGGQRDHKMLTHIRQKHPEFLASL